MDFDDYVSARRLALLRAAVLLGCPEHAADDLVRDSLRRSASAIRGGDDPDAEVYAQLRRLVDRQHPVRVTAVLADDHLAGRELAFLAGETVRALPTGEVDPPRRRAPGVVGAALVLGLALAVVLTRPDAPPAPRDRLAADQVPSLFGYDAASARTRLTELGLEVTERPTRACERRGIVLGTDPPIGEQFDAGDTVTIRTAVPADVFCMATYPDRSAAWEFVAFATGRGPAPEFAPEVQLVVDESHPATLTAAEAAQPAAWGGTSALSALAEVSRRVVLAGGAWRVPVPQGPARRSA